MKNAAIVSWRYLASLRRSGQLKCPRNGLLDSVGKLFRKMSCAACNSVGLVTRFPPWPAHPHSSVHGVRWWDAARHLHLCPSLKLGYPVHMSSPFKARQKEVGFESKLFQLLRILRLSPSDCSSGQFCTLALGR